MPKTTAKKTAAKKMTPTAGRKTSKREEPGSGTNIGPLGAGSVKTGRGGGGASSSRTSVARQMGNRVTTRMENRANIRQNSFDKDFQSWQEGVNITRGAAITAKAAGVATTAAIRGGTAAAAVAAAKGANALRKNVMSDKSRSKKKK